MTSVPAISDIPLADEGADYEGEISEMTKPVNPLPKLQSTDYDDDEIQEDAEEKARLIAQVLELQNTLDDLSQRVDNVKEESLKLRSENQVLGQYIQNLMSASSVFQSTQPKQQKKKSYFGLF